MEVLSLQIVANTRCVKYDWRRFAAGQLVYTTEDKPVALSTMSDGRAITPRV